jgi:hypothetical protein
MADGGARALAGAGLAAGAGAGLASVQACAAWLPVRVAWPRAQLALGLRPAEIWPPQASRLGGFGGFSGRAALGGVRFCWLGHGGPPRAGYRMVQGAATRPRSRSVEKIHVNMRSINILKEKCTFDVAVPRGIQAGGAPGKRRRSSVALAILLWMLNRSSRLGMAGARAAMNRVLLVEDDDAVRAVLASGAGPRRMAGRVG